MILVDSSVWIGYFNGKRSRQTDVLDNLLSQVPIIMGDLILTEVLQGFRQIVTLMPQNRIWMLCLSDRWADTRWP